MGNNAIGKVTDEKDLGVIIQDNLSVEKHKQDHTGNLQAGNEHDGGVPSHG